MEKNVDKMIETDRERGEGAHFFVLIKTFWVDSLAGDVTFVKIVPKLPRVN